MRKTKVIAAATIIVVLISYGGYRFRQTIVERDQLSQNLAEHKARYDQLQTKYKEKKAVEAALLRQKMALEGRNREIQNDLDTLEAKYQSEIRELKSQLDQAETKTKKKSMLLSKKITELEQKNDNLLARLKEEIRQKKQWEVKNSELTEEKDSISAELVQTKRTLDRCSEKNVRFSEITVDLVKRYEAHSTAQSVDPITQIKKVEIEHLVQDYIDKIDQSKFAKPEP